MSDDDAWLAPIGPDDIRESLRIGQEGSLRESERRAIARREAIERRLDEVGQRAIHKERITALLKITNRFRELMAAEGNPGLQHYMGHESMPTPGAGFLAKLFFAPEVVPSRDCWAVAIDKKATDERRRSNWPSSAVDLITLDPRGGWWHAQTAANTQGPPHNAQLWGEGSFSLSKPADLDGLGGTGFAAIHAQGNPTSLDRAVLHTIMRIADDRGLTAEPFISALR